MKYLVLDTETVGFPLSWTAPVTEVENWPQIVQLAWELYNDCGEKLKAADDLVKPEGYHIPYESTKIHGITHQQATAKGLPAKAVLEQLVKELTNEVVLVGHNVEFDINVVGAALLREKIGSNFLILPAICTMRNTVEFCALPGDKMPRLGELYFKLFNEPLMNAHRAGADVAATARCFWELKKLGVIQPPNSISQAALF